MLISNLAQKNRIRSMTFEERQTHAHYMIEFIEENVNEMYDNLMENENLSTEKAINRLAFLEAMSDALEQLNEKPILDLG